MKGAHRVICDRCGFKYWNHETRKEWNGLRVCHGAGTNQCWEPRHPQDFVRARPDRQTVRDPRPEGADIFISTLQSETTALVARFTDDPGPIRHNIINRPVYALKQAGLWSKLTGIWLPGHDAQATQRNWISDEYNLAVSGAPVFTGDRGYQGVVGDDTAYLDTGVDQTDLEQNDHAIGVLTALDTNPALAADMGTSQLSITSRGSGNFATRSANGTIKDVTIGTSLGLFSISRSSAAGYQKYLNGVLVDSATQASAAMTSQNILLLARNNGSGAAVFASGRPVYAAYVCNQALSAADTAAIYTIIRDYCFSVGATF